MNISRKHFLASLLAGSAGVAMSFGRSMASELEANVTKTVAGKDFHLYDLHVHASDGQSIEDIYKKSQRLNIPFGIMQNVAPYGIRNDEDLRAFIDSVKAYPLWRGLQPMGTGWSKNLSKELIACADYVLLDPQTIKKGNSYGDTLEVWEHDCYIPDAEAFMEVNMAHYLSILENDERMDILGWPLYLPPCIARDYYKLWTEKRMDRIISAAKSRGVAIEINDLAHTPHREFILMAKAAGLKFAFGSDTRDYRTGRLDYCRQIASECGLTDADLWRPNRVISAD
ncbi:MAG: hypothetical protein IJQ31_06020 [Thermoguttaceae bacterium]|nr:hypothetical protein [Thermoguttaceae bacterium]